jgi:hypothetical protein
MEFMALKYIKESFALVSPHWFIDYALKRFSYSVILWCSQLVVLMCVEPLSALHVSSFYQTSFFNVPFSFCLIHYADCSEVTWLCKSTVSKLPYRVMVV